MDNTQSWGDRGPQSTTQMGSQSPSAARSAFLGSSVAAGPRLLRGLTLLPAMSRAAIPTPADGDGTGSRGPRTATASLPSPAASPAPALVAPVLGNGGSGWETGRMGQPQFSPQPATHRVWGQRGRRASLAPLAGSRDSRSLRGVLGTAAPSVPGWGIYGTRVRQEGVGALAAHTPSWAGHRPISSPWGPGSAGMDPLRCLIGFCGHVTALKNIIIKLQNTAHKLALESDSRDKWDPHSR